jgi:sphingomyelin phosphodiesterase
VIQRYKNTIAAQFFGHSHMVLRFHSSFLYNLTSDNRTSLKSPILIGTIRQLKTLIVSYLSHLPLLQQVGIVQKSCITAHIELLPGGNPAFKMYDVDPDTFEIIDMKVFLSECDLSNKSFAFNLTRVLANISDPTFQTSRE